jgi:cytochrome b561
MQTTGRPRAATDRYRPLTKFLHWAMVVAFGVQFAIGYRLDADGGGHGRGRGRGRGEGSGHGRGRGRGGDGLDVFGDDTLLTVHVMLGVTILVLAAVRLYWRRRVGLPPWAPTLTAPERTFEHWTERAMYALMFAVPLTGLAVVLGSDDLVALHVATHLAFFAVVAGHIGLVLKHQVIERDRLLRRML